MTIAAHGEAMLEPEDKPGQTTHPSIQCHVGADPAFTSTSRTRSGVAVYNINDGACGRMTLLAPSKLMRQHRATGQRREPRAVLIVKPAAMALPGGHTQATAGWSRSPRSDWVAAMTASPEGMAKQRKHGMILTAEEQE
ncbi:uncharacterized protein TrAFT101_010119 [Trichoderma asperellum]|uniref:uncharacterized protein n=1 Tax=Trichoderma asperellum TaxID=101201 RepID=UPI00332FFD30|nr:hypothetical protein TrAFT101_010119 [Trichoderma asperellum]